MHIRGQRLDLICLFPACEMVKDALLPAQNGGLLGLFGCVFIFTGGVFFCISLLLFVAVVAMVAVVMVVMYFARYHIHFEF